MPKRKGSARWEGGLKTGKGSVSTETGVLKEIPYNFPSRFEEGDQTNPEELIGAAHAACFSMALSGDLEEAGYDPQSIETENTVTLSLEGGEIAISKIEISTVASVPGIDDEEFQKIAEGAKGGCPVSKALTGVEFVLNASLK